MGGTTPKLAIPYPTGTDRVADGDNAMQSLAERIEALAAPAWQIPALQAGWAVYGGPYSPPRFAKVFNWVIMEGLVGCANKSGLIFTLPVGYRPIDGSIMVGAYTDFSTVRIDIATSGTVTAMAAVQSFVTLNSIIFNTSASGALAKDEEEDT